MVQLPAVPTSVAFLSRCLEAAIVSHGDNQILLQTPFSAPLPFFFFFDGLSAFYWFSFRILQKTKVRNQVPGFPRGLMVKNSPANAGDTGSIPDPGRSHILQSN